MKLYAHVHEISGLSFHEIHELPFVQFLGIVNAGEPKSKGVSLKEARKMGLLG